MDKTPSSYQRLLNNLTQFLRTDSGEEGWWQRFSDYVVTGAQLGADELQLFQRALAQDMSIIAAQWQTDADNSTLWQGIKESLWQDLVEVADHTQLEWHELSQDLQHQGLYQVGDWVGFGVLVCDACGYRQEVPHPLRVTECPQCAHHSFSRELAQP